MDKETLGYYQDNAEEYVEFSSLASLDKQHDRFISLLKSSKGSILDLGFGGGRDSLYFQNLGFQVTSLDGCQAFVEHGKNIGLKKPILGDIEDMEYQEEFDGVWANASLLHLKKERLASVFDKIYKALRSGGVFYCSFKVGSFQGIRDGRFYTDLTEEDLKELYRNSSFVSMELEADDDSLKRDCIWLEAYFVK